MEAEAVEDIVAEIREGRGRWEDGCGMAGDGG